MAAIVEILWLIAAWFVCAVVSMRLAQARNHNETAWFFIGLFFGPLGLAVGLFPPLKNRHEFDCPTCYGVADRRAIRCRHCGLVFAQTKAPGQGD